MSFLDQFSVWEILFGLLLILVVNTVLFKLLVDWNQAQPLDDGEALASPPGTASSLSASNLESSSSLATSSVPPSNRPRRRKHLQALAATSTQPDAVAETRPEPVTAHDAPAVEEKTAAVPEPVTLAVAPVEVPRPVVAFSPEPEMPSEPVPVVLIPAFIEPAPVVEPVTHEEKSPITPEPTPVPTVTIPEPVVPAEEVPIPVLNLSPVLPTVADTPAVNTAAPESPAPAETVTPRKVEAVTPSSDLVLQPSADSSAQPPAPAPTPTPAAPAPAARSSFRRAIAPARLFLTREFSSVRIRSRQLNEPAAKSEPEPGTTPTGPAPAEPDLHSSEPAIAAETLAVVPPAAEPPASEAPVAPAPAPEPIVVPPASEVPVAPAPEPEPITPPTAEVHPPAEAIPQAEPVPPARPPQAQLEPVAEPPSPPESAPTPEPEPVAVIEPTPPPVVEPEPVHEPFAIQEPTPAPLPEPEPAHVPEVAVPTPELTVEAPEVIPTSNLIHMPDPSETLPVVDISPEAAILPPPVTPLPEEEPPVIHPEPVISQPIEPFIPIPHMASVQPVTGERATAQLTLSLEVASLQLTPAFKLGSVQLRPLSNVVSLQLGAGVGPQPANNPLAANISFEIQSVQTGGDGQIQSLVLKPLPAARADTTPHPKLQVDAVQLTRGIEAGPIQITPASATSTAVQLLTTYAIAGIDFTPNFEIGTMRLEPVTRTVMLRLNQPGGAELPPAFEIATVQLGADAQIIMVQLTPTTL